LRIGITESAGATMLYLAGELNLYDQNGVHASVVELADYEALEHAFSEKQVDAIVFPHGRAAAMIKERHSDAGVLLVLAIASTTDSSAHWQTEEEELLIVRRSEVMHRRAEWNRLLTAYEHARKDLDSYPDSVAAYLALREHRDPVQVRNEISVWSFFGLPEQDSLLDVRTNLNGLDARWQGNLEFAGGPAHRRGDRSSAAKETEQQRSR
jgi:hypothetical protein